MPKRKTKVFIMIYYNENDILIRDLVESDAEIIAHEEHLQGLLDKQPARYFRRLKDVADGKCVSLVAEYKGNPAGYINVYFDSQWGAFAGKGWPEIIDMRVLEKYQKNGVGNMLMNIAEDISKKYSDTVYLGVGVNSNYGSAFRMYVKHGFVPDGTGLWRNDEHLENYTDIKYDDDVIIYMSKKF